MSERDELRAAEGELADAYRLFNWSDDPRLIDEAIHRIRIAEMRLDYLTHPAAQSSDGHPVLPWLVSPADD
ncbi:MAG: hypothetical protein M0Z66_09740 [Thermaerobacter sp.]|nr:hypothetical protein [Thermaerobacter sp.]